jgi:hypothetical protein
MKNFLLTAFGTAVGTLLYTGLLSSAHEFDWGRAATVGIFSGIFAAAWPKKKRDQ